MEDSVDVIVMSVSLSLFVVVSQFYVPSMLLEGGRHNGQNGQNECQVRQERESKMLSEQGEDADQGRSKQETPGELLQWGRERESRQHSYKFKITQVTMSP